MSGSTSAAARWRGIIEEFRRGDLKQAEFCRRRGLSLHSFRKYLYGSRGGSPAVPAVEFLPVVGSISTRNAQPQNDAGPIVVILAGGRRVAVAPGFYSPTLKRLIETIEGLA